jgi:hypothetical protein
MTCAGTAACIAAEVFTEENEIAPVKIINSIGFNRMPDIEPCSEYTPERYPLRNSLRVPYQWLPIQSVEA